VRGASALAEQLAAHYEEALLYRQLATLRTDVPIAESLEELRWRGPGHGFDRLAAEWRDDKLIERVAHIAAR
jgi:5'-3' exonuclease